MKNGKLRFLEILFNLDRELSEVEQAIINACFTGERIERFLPDVNYNYLSHNDKIMVALYAAETGETPKIVFDLYKHEEE